MEDQKTHREEIKEKIKSWTNRIWVAGILVISLIMFLCALPHIQFGRYAGSAAPVRELTTATVTIDGKEKNITLPDKIENLAPGTDVEVNLTFDNRETNTYIDVRSAFCPLTVYVNGVQVFTYGAKDERPPFMKDPGTIVYLIPVHKLGNVHITLHYKASYSRREVIVPKIYLSNQSGLFRMHFMKDALTIVESTTMIIVGILLMAISPLIIFEDTRGKLFLLLGAHLALTGGWGISSCDAILFLFNWPNIWYLFGYICFFSLIIPLELFLETSVQFHCGGLLVHLRHFLMALLPVLLLLQLTGLVMFPQSVLICQVIISVSEYAFTIGVFYETIRWRNRAAALWIIPMCILCSGAAAEIYRYMASVGYSNPHCYILTEMLFGLYMCVVGGNEIRKSIIIARKEKEQEFQLSIMNMEVSEQRKYQETVLANEQELRRQRHDYRHQITILEDYLRKGQLDRLAAHLSLLRENIPKSKNVRYTENIAVNAVVTYYAQAAENAGAKVTADISLPSDLSERMSTNICLIIGNLMENAAEAISRMPSGDKDRYLRIGVVEHMGHIVIHMENSMAGKPRKWGHYYISSKRNEVGIGLTSVANLAALYDGNAEFNAEEGKFVSDVYLTIK